MRCQWCGYVVDDANLAACPNCGSALPSAGEAGGQPSAPISSQPPAQPGYFGHEPAAASGAPGTPYGWPAPPSMPLGQPPSGQYPYAPPAYGQPAPPSIPYGAPPPYPYPAPPSIPLGAPYPGYPAGAPLSPLPAPRQRRTGLIVVGAIAAVLVVCVGGLGVLSVLGRQLANGGISALNPTALTPTASVAPNETIIYQNDMTRNTIDWSDSTHCFLGAGGYHVKSDSPNESRFCYAPVGTQSDFDARVDAMQIGGPADTGYGLTMRVGTDPNSRYDFIITASGFWGFYKCLANTVTCSAVVGYHETSAVHGGLNTKNSLEVMASGAHFVFSVNGTKVGEATDSDLASGKIALYVNANMECVFTNVVVARPK